MHCQLDKELGTWGLFLCFFFVFPHIVSVRQRWRSSTTTVSVYCFEMLLFLVYNTLQWFEIALQNHVIRTEPNSCHQSCKYKLSTLGKCRKSSVPLARVAASSRCLRRAQYYGFLLQRPRCENTSGVIHTLPRVLTSLGDKPPSLE